MRRTPCVILAEDRTESSLVTDLLSNVYTTVVPASLRGIASSDSTEESPQASEVACCDTLGQLIAFGYSDAGYRVWTVAKNGAKATELICESDGPPVRLIKFLKGFRPDPSSRRRKNDSVEDFSDAWGDVSSNGGKPAGFELPDLAYVDGTAENVVKLVSLNTGKVTEELQFPHVVTGIVTSSRMFGVVLKDFSARVIMRSDVKSFGSSTTFVLPHAHPLALGSRWVAYGANSEDEARASSDVTSMTTSPLLAPQGGWGDVTKILAASAFKLGEIGSKKITEYMQNSPKSGIPVDTEIPSPRACDMILVRDLVSDKVVCRMLEFSSYLQFDESGSLLVSAVKDGQSIHVYSLPKGQVLYKLERGLRPARILSVCFSPDRKWLAVSSTRGTTHLFAIHPSGERATYSTHRVDPNTANSTIGVENTPSTMAWLTSTVMGNGGSSNGGTSVARAGSTVIGSPSPMFASVQAMPRYMKEIHHEVVAQGSLAKISQASGMMPVLAVSFPRRDHLSVISQRGIVEDSLIVPNLPINLNDKDEIDRLEVEIKPTTMLDLTRTTEDSSMSVNPPSVGINGVAGKGLKSNSSSIEDMRGVMDMLSYDVSVSNFETQAFVDPLVPVWASPQFVMLQATSSSQKVPDSTSLFYNISGQPIVSQAETPPPGLTDAIRTPAFGTAAPSAT